MPIGTVKLIENLRIIEITVLVKPLKLQQAVAENFQYLLEIQLT